MDTKIRAEGRSKNNLDKNCHEQTNNNNQKEQEKSFRNSQPFTKLNKAVHCVGLILNYLREYDRAPTPVA